jgi:UDP-N-acetylglucosamine--N-acetylmuramyl-(pentapeptide) pyrophosphoryl-undecaprenol N-acetylglucosamine transferase
MEAGLIRQESRLPFLAIPAAALNGRNPLIAFRNLLILLRGTIRAWRMIGSEKPQAILGTGGYVCVPVFLAAWLRRVPTVVFLPDVRPGLAVRLLARIASAVACSVAASRDYFAGTELVVTGYPVRRELFEQQKTECRSAFGLQDSLPVLLVTGGSRGARSINKAIAALLPQLLPFCQIVHVCGREGDDAFLAEAAQRLPAALQERYAWFPYLHSGSGETPSMIQALVAADLVVCRSGASTLGELPALGLPAVLVPYPFVHQEENAEYLQQHGAASQVADDSMLGMGQPEVGPLFQELRRLLQEPNERTSMARSSRDLAQPMAARQLAELLLALASRRGAA